MFRILFISLFLVISSVLYMEGGADSASSTATPIRISSPSLKRNRTVSKEPIKVAESRRFTTKKEIADKLAQKRHAKRYVIAASSSSYLPVETLPPTRKKTLKSTNKFRIAVLIKAELKRVGCYKGIISGSWDNKTHNALDQFNLATAQNLDKSKPTLAALTSLKQYQARSCRRGYQVASLAPTTLNLAYLPTSRPQSSEMIQVGQIETTAQEAAIVPAAQNKPVQKVFRKFAREPKKIAAFDALQDDDSYFNTAPKTPYYKKARRPSASTVGRWKRAAPKRRAKTRKRRLAQVMPKRRKIRRYKKARLRKASRRHRRIRRRYRRARRRFGYSFSGELGYW